MIHLEIPENPAYNPMIYIPFFIVILIDKRGVREAERLEHKYEYRYEYRTHHHRTPPPRERDRQRKKRYEPAAHPAVHTA